MNSTQYQQPIANNDKTDTINASSDPAIEPWSEYHHIEWYYNHQIAGTPTLGNPKRALVVDWSTMVKRVFDQWPQDKPILIIADLRREKASSPYQNAKGMELMDCRLDQRAYVAIVTANHLAGQITRLALKARNRRNGAIHIFFTHRAGLDWPVKVGNIQR